MSSFFLLLFPLGPATTTTKSIRSCVNILSCRYLKWLGGWAGTGAVCGGRVSRTLCSPGADEAVSRACPTAFNACVYKFCTPFVAVRRGKGRPVGVARGMASFFWELPNCYCLCSFGGSTRTRTRIAIGVINVFYSARFHNTNCIFYSPRIG